MSQGKSSAVTVATVPDLSLIYIDIEGHEHRVSVQVLRLEPGDVIVIQSADQLTDQACGYIREGLHRLFPDHEVAILDSGLKVGLIRKA